MTAAPHIYVDADACPVKAETVKVAERHGLHVVFVANAWFAAPRAPRVRVQVVGGSFDAADDWIADRSRLGRTPSEHGRSCSNYSAGEAFAVAC